MSDDEAIVAEGPSVEIAGKTYKLRRLEARDVFTFSRLLSRAFRRMNIQEIMTLDLGAGMALIGEIAGRELAEWLAGIIGVTPQEFERMPPEAPVLVWEALEGTVDMQAFFNHSMRLLTRIGLHLLSAST